MGYDKVQQTILSVKEKATKNKATKMTTIDPSIIPVRQWVRNKCQFGCACFGKNFSCPPYVPSIKETQTMLKEYRVGLLIEFVATNSIRQQELKEVMWELEREAFLAGLVKAFSFSGGPCRRCTTCMASECIGMTIGAKGKCRYPELLRPSMESAGIDVFGLVEKLGWEIKTIEKKEQPFQSYGLLLLE
jgi:predicted metal-binding protein